MAHFQTEDIYLAAALLAQGFVVQRTDRNPRNPHLRIFTLEDSTGLRETIAHFASGTLTGNIRSFISSWRELRRQCDY